MKSGLKRGLIIGGIAAAIIIVVIASSLKGKEKLTHVDFFTVKCEPLEEKVSATGSFMAESSATIYCKVSGAVQEILVEEGQRVRKGDFLLKIDEEDYLRNLENAKAALESARRAARQGIVNLRANYNSTLLSYTQADRNYKNNKELFAAQAISEDALKQSEDAFKTAQLSLQSAREQLNLKTGMPLDAEPILDPQKDTEIIDEIPETAQAKLSLKTAQKALKNCMPISTMNGTVTQIIPSVGDFAAPNTPLVKIQSLDSMIAEIQIDEVDIGKIKNGSQAEITSDSILGKTLTGTVSAISPVILKIGNTRMSTVKIEIHSSDIELKSGASCTVRIITLSRDDALVIPLTAYTTKDDKSFVYVLTDNEEAGNPESFDQQESYILKKREITTGITTINQVEVLSGLKEGEKIAVGNISLYREELVVIPGEER